MRVVEGNAGLGRPRKYLPEKVSMRVTYQDWWYQPKASARYFALLDGARLGNDIFLP